MFPSLFTANYDHVAKFAQWPIRGIDICNFQVFSLNMLLLDFFFLIIGYDIAKPKIAVKLLC